MDVVADPSESSLPALVSFTFEPTPCLEHSFDADMGVDEPCVPVQTLTGALYMGSFSVGGRPFILFC